MGLPGSEHATIVNPDYTIHLQNSGDNNNIIQSAEIPAKTIRDMLSYIGFRNAPFNAMIGVLSLAQSLFYPTDNEHIDEALAYYRQREWRITAGYDINGHPPPSASRIPRTPWRAAAAKHESSAMPALLAISGRSPRVPIFRSDNNRRMPHSAEEVPASKINVLTFQPLRPHETGEPPEKRHGVCSVHFKLQPTSLRS
jgi:hypothetical protein